MIIEISVGMIAFAFIILVIYLIICMNTIKLTLDEVRLTTKEVRESFKLVGEAKPIIDNFHLISMNVSKKMELLDSLFMTISNTGDYLEKKSAHLKQEINQLHSQENFHQNTSKIRSPELARFAEIVELIGVSIRLWQKFKGD